MTLNRLKAYLANSHGVTLIELVIALSLTAIILGVIGTFFISNYHSFNDARDTDIVLEDINTVTNAIDEALRESKGIVEAKKTGTDYDTFTVLASDDVTKVTFSIVGNTITQKTGVGAPVVLTTHATGMVFKPVQTHVVSDIIYVSDTNNSFTASETRALNTQ